MEVAPTHRILHVEDDRYDAEHLHRALKQATSAHFALIHVETLAAALEWLAVNTPDLIALDLSLPDGEGEALFDSVARAARGVGIVVLTGLFDDQPALRLLERGAQDYLLKNNLAPREIARCFEHSIQRANVERELAEAKNRAEEAAHAKSTFLATMSHEIRTPLNAVLGMADLLRRTTLTPDQLHYVEVLHAASQGLRDLLDNVLELARAESGEIELDEEPFDLGDLVTSTTEMFALQAHRKRIDILADVAPSLARYVRGDRSRIRQMLSNLIANAVKFTDAGRVVVRASYVEPEGRVQIEVEDTGAGVAEEHRESIFERFVQAGSDTFARSGGSGLGLAICRELATRMGGSVRVRAGESGGSVFELALALPMEPESSDRALPRLEGRRVLIVDDDPVERECYQRWVAWVGAESVAFDKVDAARAALAAGEHFDAALIDSRMPHEGGFGLAESLAREGAHNVVVAFHMNHREEDLARAAALGVNALHKPMRLQTLLNSLAGNATREAPQEHEKPDLRARVLVADDSPDNLLLVKSFAKGTDLELVYVADGLAAAKAVEEGHFDLVLMDVSMPLLSGLEATRRIRAFEQTHHLPRTPIVALSAHALREHFRESEAAGCDAHVVKPFDRATLLGAIARYGRVAAQPDVPVEPEIADLVPAYLKRRRADVAQIRAALIARNFEEVKTLGHRMKGSGAGYGFSHISSIGADLEEAAQRLDPQAVECGADALEKFLVDLDAPQRTRIARADAHP